MHLIAVSALLPLTVPQRLNLNCHWLLQQLQLLTPLLITAHSVDNQHPEKWHRGIKERLWSPPFPIPCFVELDVSFLGSDRVGNGILDPDFTAKSYILRSNDHPFHTTWMNYYHLYHHFYHFSQIVGRFYSYHIWLDPPAKKPNRTGHHVTTWCWVTIEVLHFCVTVCWLCVLVYSKQQRR